jgi:hypothetical protein
MYFRVLFLLISFTLLHAGCSNNRQVPEQNSIIASQKAEPQKPPVTIPTIKEFWLDFIEKFKVDSDVVKEGDSSSYVGIITTIENNKVSILAITDSAIFLFQQRNKKWIQMDSAPFDNYLSEYEVTDLNGDGHDDLVITESGDVHGMACTDIFLNKNGKLQYIPGIHLYNIEYHPQTKLVSSFYYGSMNGNCKEYYRWVGDSLVLVRGAEQDESDNGPDYVTFYRLKNGKRFDYKEVDDSDGTVFDTALWKDQ